MDNLEENIRQLVQEALKGMNLSPEPAEEDSAKGIFTDINSAVFAADVAFHKLSSTTLELRKQLIANMRTYAHRYKETYCKMASEETGFGRWQDKIIKNELAINKTPGVEDIGSVAYSDDNGLTLVERAPYGVVGSVTPSTNPTATIISNAIGMIAAGNSVVFNPHPAAKKVSAYLVSLLNQAIAEVGGPDNLLCCISNPTIDSAKEMMAHPKIAILVVTGGPGVVKTAMNSGKKVIGAGPGNPPVVVDETADIPKAAKDIVNGASFDNNIICICEKEILCVASVTDQLKTEMIKNGAYELNREQIRQITGIVVAEPGSKGKEGAASKNYIGKNASFIAKSIGLDLPDTVRLLLCEVDADHPLMWTEQLMPVMPITRVKDVDAAIDLAVEMEHGFRHTAIMHSLNIAKLSKMAKAMNCSIFIKNGPSYAGLGYGGAGFASFTIASPTGEGVTRPFTFTRERRCTLVDYFRIV